MRIKVSELFDLGLWDKFCNETGMNPWALNEGLIDRNEEVEWDLKAGRNDT